MSSTDFLLEFKKQLIAFFDELIEQFPQESDFVVIRIFIKDQMPIKSIMDTFVYHMNKDEQAFKKMVKDRNDKFFIEHDIFDTFGKSKANYMKRLWQSGSLDNDDKLTIWKWIDAFIIISDKYVKMLN
jgi:hypothetical protein